jgi:pullulanase/glycogen debranching enzyme
MTGYGTGPSALRGTSYPLGATVRGDGTGAEGATDDPAVLTLRARQSRAMLTTLLLSFGIPMLLGGDEIGRT